MVPTSVFNVQYSVYMLFVGGLAAATTLVASRGLWGLVSERFGWSLLPGPRGRELQTQGVRYIECGVAILAYSRHRRGPGAAWRPRNPPAGPR